MQPMDLHHDNVIGIVGGMGPRAGHALVEKILNNTAANTDQSHLSIVHMCFPKHIGDRTSFLCGDSDDNPAISIAEIIRKLEISGATIVGIACNTSHAPEIFDVVLQRLRDVNSKVRLLNMPMETCRYLRLQYSNVKRVGLMTTNGTYRTKIYETLLKNYGFDVVVPDFKFQDEVIHRMIYDAQFGIKSSSTIITEQAKALMNDALNYFYGNGVDAVILGCTELSLVVTTNSVKDMVIIDSTESLAQALIREARK